MANTELSENAIRVLKIISRGHPDKREMNAKNSRFNIEINPLTWNEIQVASALEHGECGEYIANLGRGGYIDNGVQLPSFFSGLFGRQKKTYFWVTSKGTEFLVEHFQNSFSENSKRKHTVIYKVLNSLGDYGSKTAEEIFPTEVIDEASKLTNNNRTIAEILLLERQVQFANMFVERVSYSDLVKESIEIAKRQGGSAEKVLNDEMTGQINVATEYQDRIHKLAYEGKIDLKHEAGIHIDELCNQMLSKWLEHKRRALLELDQMI